MAAKKDPNLGHTPDDSGVCSKCGLDFEAYLKPNKLPCSQADADNGEEEAPGEEA